MLANPASGVPLAHNAKYLHNFFSKGSVQDVYLVDQAVGGVVINTTRLGEGAISEDEQRLFSSNSDGTFSIGGGIGVGVYLDSMEAGTWPQVAAADDFIIIECLIAGVDTAEASAIWRIGSTPSYIRRHTAYNDGTGTSLIGAAYDEDSNTAAVFGESVSANRPNAGDVLCVVTVIDRTANLLRSKLWNFTQDKEHLLDDADMSALGDIFPSNEPDLSEAKSAPHSLIGRFYGVAHYHFPNAGLPADYFGAAIQMANAWRNGNYTFWPTWGTE